MLPGDPQQGANSRWTKTAWAHRVAEDVLGYYVRIRAAQRARGRRARFAVYRRNPVVTLAPAI